MHTGPFEENAGITLEQPAQSRPENALRRARAMKYKQSTSRGFTLIEVMITVAIIALLAAVAYPAYTDHLRKSRRAEAQSLLMNVALRQQQFLLDTRTYAADLAALQVATPAGVAPYYGVAMAVGTGAVPEFTVTATPLGSQAGDKCGVLELDQNGTKSPDNCW